MRAVIAISVIVVLVTAAAPGWAQWVCPTVASRLNASATPCPLFVCPEGDTPSFSDQGWSIDLWVYDVTGIPIPGIPASDFWFIDCDATGDVALCGGAASTYADGPTDANGKATMSQATLIGGGCADGMGMVIQGWIVEDSTTSCTTPKCFPIWTRSPDIDGNLRVDLVDLAIFAGSFPPQSFDRCCDMNIDGIVGLQDMALFAFHFGPPGHGCL